MFCPWRNPGKSVIASKKRSTNYGLLVWILTVQVEFRKVYGQGRCRSGDFESQACLGASKSDSRISNRKIQLSHGTIKFDTHPFYSVRLNPVLT